MNSNKSQPTDRGGIAAPRAFFMVLTLLLVIYDRYLNPWNYKANGEEYPSFLADYQIDGLIQ